MGATLGTDYALAKRTTWMFPGLGVRPATGVLTKQALYLFPLRGLRARGDAGAPAAPLDVVTRILGEAADGADLDRRLRDWAAGLEGPVVEPMLAVKRVRIFNGWLRRGVAFSEKDAGYDLKPKSVWPKKDEMPAFISLLKDHPGLEMK